MLRYNVLLFSVVIKNMTAIRDAGLHTWSPASSADIAWNLRKNWINAPSQWLLFIIYSYSRPVEHFTLEFIQNIAGIASSMYHSYLVFAERLNFIFTWNLLRYLCSTMYYLYKRYFRAQSGNNLSIINIKNTLNLSKVIWVQLYIKRTWPAQVNYLINDNTRKLQIKEVIRLLGVLKARNEPYTHLHGNRGQRYKLAVET